MPAEPRRSARPDDGFTLTELLVTVAILGAIVTVLAGAIVVVLRQVDSTEGRANVARAEQSLDTWLPTDLASIDPTDAASADTTPSASPCGAAVCDGIDMSGANALQLTWSSILADGTPETTVVQYQYIQVGTEWQLQRVECNDRSGALACSMVPVLHDLEAPPTDLVPPYDPDTTNPSWILAVTTPTVDAGLDLNSNGRRLIVTVNGGGGSAGSGGGENVISISAGGATTGTIDPDDFELPDFVRANSRCGGPITFIADNSASISDISVVEGGINAAIEAFRGTPVRVQIVRFGVAGSTLGTTGFRNYYDMSDDAEVDAAKLAVVNGLSGSEFGTNWEDGWFRTLYEADGSSATEMPNRIIFFTDGLPNRSRLDARNDTADLTELLGVYPKPPTGNWPNTPGGNTFHQEAADRATVIALQAIANGIDVIAVGVDGAVNGPPVSWIRDFDLPATPPASRGTVVSTTRDVVLSRVLTGGHSGGIGVEEAVPVGGPYTNPETADLYLLSDYAAFGDAMRAAALKDCGGTLTVQTRLADGTKVGDEFIYERIEYRDQDGTVESTPGETPSVTTSSLFPTGTFDFEHGATDLFFSVDVAVGDGASSSYVPVDVGAGAAADAGWSCRAGSAPKTPTVTPQANGYSTVTVDVAPNEAVSCILTVEATP